MANLDHFHEYIKTPNIDGWTEVKIDNDEVAKLPTKLHGRMIEDVSAYYFEDERDAIMVQLTLTKIND